MVAVDDQGLVRAMVGSRHVVRGRRLGARTTRCAATARRRRSPGSTFKPLVLAEAHPRGVLARTPASTPRGRWSSTQWTHRRASRGRSATTPRATPGVMDLRRGHRRVVEHGVRPAHARPRHRHRRHRRRRQPRHGAGPGQRRRPGRAMGVGGASGIPAGPDARPPWCSARSTPRPSRWPASTRRSPTAASTRQPDIVTRVEQVERRGRRRRSSSTSARSPSDAGAAARRRPTSSPTRCRRWSATGARARAPRSTARRRQDGHLAAEPERLVRRLRAGLTAVVWMGYPDAGDGTGGRPRAPEFDDELWPMNENGRLVHGRPATGGSFPATIWRKFMEVGVGQPDGRVRRADPRADPQRRGPQRGRAPDPRRDDATASRRRWRTRLVDPGPDPADDAPSRRHDAATRRRPVDDHDDRPRRHRADDQPDPAPGTGPGGASPGRVAHRLAGPAPRPGRQPSTGWWGYWLRQGKHHASTSSTTSTRSGAGSSAPRSHAPGVT